MSTITINETSPRIYVACLAAYNNGILHGKWIDVCEGYDHVIDSIKDMLKSSPLAEECEEWAIHDFEGFGDFRVSECFNIEVVCALAELMKEYRDRFSVKAISWLVNDYGIEDAKERMDDDFLGEFDRPIDLAYHCVEEFGVLDGTSETVARYFDYESFGRDLELNGDIFSVDDYYFWNR